MADADCSVLADLLIVASEAGPARLVETDRLLRELFGPDPVQAAHREWTDRLRAGAAGPGGDVFDLTRRLRAAGSRGRR